MTEIIATQAYKDQKPGTSGLRKKVTVFQQPHYLANFVQATFNVLEANGGIPEVLVVGGDGRYWGKEACQIIIKIALANGVKRLWIGENALLSTPAVSAIVREREGGFVAKGAFILTASHNPGGPTEDFGIKYNGENGGPAPEKLTNLIFSETLAISSYKVAGDAPVVDLAVIGKTNYNGAEIEVISSTEDYIGLLRKVFDFDALRKLVQRPDFSFVVDAMHGVAGPYATKVFVDILGAPTSSLLNAVPKEDFGQGHPDPNLTYAHELVEIMGLHADGSISEKSAEGIPAFGAAFDGDADRNMILGRQFFVTPSDSVALIAANSTAIPYFAAAGGVRSVARSMPTSGALDRVATALNIKLAEVPTGWKFFGNLMDSKTAFGGADYNPLICGEESFGTGSNHVREKDGLWAVLAWLSVIAAKNEGSATFISVQQIVEAHWKQFGRNYYCRYDYEGVTTEGADKVLAKVRATAADQIPLLGGVACVTIDDFEYKDPVDGSVSPNQGVRVLFADGSRFVLRLSGTGSSGATIRLYMEQYMGPEDVAKNIAEGSLPATRTALAELVTIALTVANIEAFTGRNAPTVIT
ncbi:phosphoglucomutase, putative [Bodo saltans]|uniref:phosphoglucomutase (alpha-D-glucose-1,6-bisphosphate-dependent) n=1 Tax=Bodo saltans TaxID=75058 RepID=A0A0S4IYR2_BODSA|nr:phosphoglucomutase, putative [Bodo saltans]|eukprot:CUG54559.1 phosphoglucomutase, putative [Bodo saltans]